MKVDWLEYKNKKHVLSWFVAEVVGEIGKDKLKDFDPSNLDVSLTVNGETVSLMKHMDNLNNQLDSIEKSGYRKGYREAIIDACNKLDDLECDV